MRVELPCPQHITPSDWARACRNTEILVNQRSARAPRFVDPGGFASEALLALWRAAEVFSGPSSAFPAYAASAVRKAMVDELRRQQVRHLQVVGLEFADGLTPPRDPHAGLWDLVASLPYGEQVVLDQLLGGGTTIAKRTRQRQQQALLTRLRALAGNRESVKRLPRLHDRRSVNRIPERRCLLAENRCGVSL